MTVRESRVLEDAMLIRPYEGRAWKSVWGILEPVFRAGETYAFPVDISEEDALRAWTGDPREVFVAAEQATGKVVGTDYLKPNRDGPGAHVCNCGYVVSGNALGAGVGSLMCKHSQEEAVSRGFRAMQFNLMAASNEGAVGLWKKMGFDIVGTLPGAFRHPRLGFVDAHVMYKRLGVAVQRAAEADGA